MQGDLIDLEPVLRDAVVLALPTNPVCRPGLPRAVPRVRGPRGTICRLITAMSRSTRVGRFEQADLPSELANRAS